MRVFGASVKLYPSNLLLNLPLIYPFKTHTHITVSCIGFAHTPWSAIANSTFNQLQLSLNPTTGLGSSQTELTVSPTWQTRAGVYYTIAVYAYWGSTGGPVLDVVHIGVIVGPQSWNLSVTPTSRSVGVPATVGSVSYTVSVTGQTTYRIHLSSSTGASSFSVNDRLAPFTSTMSVGVAGRSPGTYSINVNAAPVDRDGDAYAQDPVSPRTQTVQLILPTGRPMQPLAFGVALSPEPDTRSIRAGQSASFKINLRLVYGSAPAVSMGVTDLPDNSTYSFSKSSGTPPYSSDLMISTNASTPPGTYMCNVTCSALTLLNSTSVTLIVDRFKPPSLLSITTKPNTIEEGESITVTGSLMPFSPAAIQLIYRNPAGTETTRQVSTDAGNFTDTFKPDAAGDWSVKAKWAGDSIFEGSESALTRFSVKASPVKTVLPITVIAVMAIAAVLFLYLRRKRSP